MDRIRRSAGNVVIVVFLVGAISLGVRSLLTQDSRFGWGMFSHHTSYSLTYSWVMADGSLVEFDADEDLEERQTIIDSGSHSTRYGVGAVRAWIRSYLDHKYEHRPEGVVAVQAQMDYRINDGALRTETLRHPGRDSN